MGVATRVMRECREEWGEEVMSSDEDSLTHQIADEEEPPVISEEDYRKMLRAHRESQMRRKVSHTPCHAHFDPTWWFTHVQMEQDLAAREVGRMRERRQERAVPGEYGRATFQQLAHMRMYMSLVRVLSGVG